MYKPKELKHFEVDVEKHVLKLNGEDLYHCTGFHLDCEVGCDGMYHLRITTKIEPEYCATFDCFGEKIT